MESLILRVLETQLFIARYGLYPLDPHTAASFAAIQSSNVTIIFHRNFYEVKDT
jgi:hypothetical protein